MASEREFIGAKIKQKNISRHKLSRRAPKMKIRLCGTGTQILGSGSSSNNQKFWTLAPGSKWFGKVKIVNQNVLFVQLYYCTRIDELSRNDILDTKWDMCKKVWEISDQHTNEENYVHTRQRSPIN